MHLLRVRGGHSEFSVSSLAREGGILVLPDGASREDFVPNTSLLEYIEGNGTRMYRTSPGGRLTLSAMDHCTSLPAAIKLIPRYVLPFPPGIGGQASR